MDGAPANRGTLTPAMTSTKTEQAGLRNSQGETKLSLPKDAPNTRFKWNRECMLGLAKSLARVCVEFFVTPNFDWASLTSKRHVHWLTAAQAQWIRYRWPVRPGNATKEF
jgi:hypothetical protein